MRGSAALDALPEGFSSGPASSQAPLRVASAESMPLPSQRPPAAASASAASGAVEEEENALFDWGRLMQARRGPSAAPSSVGGGAPRAALSGLQTTPAVLGGLAPFRGGGAAAKTSPLGRSSGAAVGAKSAGAAEAEAGGPRDGTDALGRRVWDKAFYEAKAKDKDADLLDLLPKPRQKPQPPPLPPSGQRHQLKQREFQIDLEREVGRTKVVTLQTPKMQQGGFWCDVCECLIKDSQAYLAHINGKNHNRLLGMSMRVERVSLAAVKAKLLEKRKQVAGEDSALSLPDASAVPPGSAPSVSVAEGEEDGLDEFDRVKRRLEQLQREEELKKKRRAEKKKAKRSGKEGSQRLKPNDSSAGADAAPPSGEDQAETAALAAMGLPTSFV